MATTKTTATTKTAIECVEAGKRPGEEADFSTALLTKGVSSFGRNDVLLSGEENRQ
jgi:hypothetical protein